MDVTFLLLAFMFTLITIIVTTMLLKNNSPSAASNPENSQRRVEGSGPSLDLTENPVQADKGLSSAKTSKKEYGFTERISDLHVSAGEEGPTTTEVRGHEDMVSSGLTGVFHCKPVPSGNTATVKPYRPVSMELTSAPVDWPGRDPGITAGAREELKEVGADSPSLKHIPGVLWISQLENMMTKEELQEEQRVQQEQLTAIFQLLKENQETFGDVSEGDVEEQLRLYSL